MLGRTWEDLIAGWDDVVVGGRIDQLAVGVVSQTETPGSSTMAGDRQRASRHPRVGCAGSGPIAVGCTYLQAAGCGLPYSSAVEREEWILPTWLAPITLTPWRQHAI